MAMKTDNNNNNNQIIYKNSERSDSIASTNTQSNHDDDTNLDLIVGTQKKNSMTEFILKQRNIGPNGAYNTAQKLKKQCNVQKVDLSENSFQDEGVIYVSIALKSCLSITYLNLSSNSMTHYGLRILLEHVNMSSLRYLNISANPIGNNGMESLSNFLEMTDSLEILNISSINLEEEGAKKLGVSLSLNASLKKIDLSWNHIRSQGAAVLSKGLGTNSTIEEVDLSYNGFAMEGALAMSECLKCNTSIKVLDLSCNRLTYECAAHLANALRQNRTLQQFNLSNNSITTTGVYQILVAINNEQSCLEYLGLKNVAMLKHVYVIIELIQQKRQFTCEIGPVIIYADNLGVKLAPEDDPMLKLSKYLIEKRLRLIDMFRILDKKQMLRMDKEEFIKRLKIFEPRLKTRDVFAIADTLATGNIIEYSKLFRQVHQTKSEIIAQENTIIKLRLQTLKKNKRYMKNIENQFNTLRRQSISYRSSIDVIEDWIKESDDGSDPRSRRLSKVASMSNRMSIVPEDNSLYLLKENNSNKSTSRSLINNKSELLTDRSDFLQNESISKSDNNFKLADEADVNSQLTIVSDSKTLPRIVNTSRTPRYNQIINTSLTKHTYLKRKTQNGYLPNKNSKPNVVVNKQPKQFLEANVKINFENEIKEEVA